jgi:hypothetical protein
MWGHGGAGMRVVVDSGRNTLRLLIPLDDESGAGSTTGGTAASIDARRAVLDVGEAGRLLGLEIDHDDEDASDVEPWYLPLEEAPGRHLRSVPVTIAVARDSAGSPVWVDLPRRGDGYELTFPIGNQCWVRPRRRTD